MCSSDLAAFSCAAIRDASQALSQAGTTGVDGSVDVLVEEEEPDDEDELEVAGTAVMTAVASERLVRVPKEFVAVA